MECGFYLEVIAPNGLASIGPQLEKANIGLCVYLSGFNNKSILTNTVNSKIDLGMDSSTTDVMTGSGYVESDFREANELLSKLSEIFKSVDLPHKIGVDDEYGGNTIWYSHKYS